MKKNNEWVQEYTIRGSPVRGKFRYRTRCEKRQEIIAGIMIAAAMVLVMFLPAILRGA